MIDGRDARYDRGLSTAILAAGALLRILLCYANPASNFYDDHFEPIALLLRDGAVAAKDACRQCYHPPVYTWICAKLGSILLAFGLAADALPKLAQGLSCAFGIAQLAVLRRILDAFPLDPRAAALALATACFLPAHVYASAMISNDTLACLAMTVCVLLLLRALRQPERLAPHLALGAAATVAIFTKYTAFAVIPALVAGFGTALVAGPRVHRRRRLLAALLAVAIPVAALGAYALHNRHRYGSALPWPVAQDDFSKTQPRAPSGIGFVTFKPWVLAGEPILTPRNLDSFWTLIHGRMWFDVEPKFVYFTDGDPAWWMRYYDWLRGAAPFPADPIPLGPFTRAVAGLLIGAGLIPLAFGVHGATRLARKPTDAPVVFALAALLAANTAGIVGLAVRLPVYSVMKATFFLGSLPALLVFLGAGLEPAMRSPRARRAVRSVFAVLFATSAIHVSAIVRALLGD